MKKSANSKPKKVGFAPGKTQIPAAGSNPIEQSPTRQNAKFTQSYVEFEVEKAREFEPYKQLPRYSHTPLAVISPLPKRKIKELSHIPPKSLAFDGSTLNLSPQKR